MYRQSLNTGQDKDKKNVEKASKWLTKEKYIYIKCLVMLYSEYCYFNTPDYTDYTYTDYSVICTLYTHCAYK